MQIGTLGRTSISVSRVGLGTMMLGEMIPPAEAKRQLSHAVERGINFIDTSEMYPAPLRPTTFGLTETLIGEWLSETGLRDRLVLSTKVVGPPPREVIGPTKTLAYIRDGKTRQDRANLRAGIEGSLRRLKTDYIDLFQPHWPDRSTNDFKKLGYVHDPKDRPVPIEETLDALDELVREGKVRAIGVSNETPWGLSRYLSASERQGKTRVATITNAYNLLCRTFEVGLAEFAHREDVGLLAYSPLAMGVLSGKYLDGNRPDGARLSLYPHPRYTSEAAQRATAAYAALAREHGVSLAAMALGFVAEQPFLVSSLIGASTIAQLDADIDASLTPLTADLRAGIAAIHAAISNPGP